MKRLAPPLVLLVLPVLLVLFLSPAGWSGDQPSFSRSRWIQEQKAWGAHFSGSVLPAGRERLPAFDSLAPAAPPAKAVARHVRISQDLLEPNGGPAETETQTEPFVALNPERESHLLAGYQENRFADGGARALAYAVSFNGGKSWSEGLLPELTAATGGPFERASDPWVAFGPGGRAYYVSLAFNERSPDNGIFVSASDDGGLTWGPPVAVRTDAVDFNDKEAMTVDTRADSPYQGRIYVGWDTITADERQLLRVAFSDDGGGSFRPAVTVHGEGANIGAFPVVGPQGVVHLVWTHFTFDGGFQSPVLLAAKSTDGGASWSAPVVVSDLRPFGVAGQRTGGILPSAAVDPRTGDLYVAWQDERFSPGTDQVVLSRSTDGGETWSEPQLVSDGPRNAANFTPAVAVNANGLVGVAYYSMRNDPSRQVLVDEYLAISRDRGRRFGRSLRVSAASWDVRFAAVSRGFFLGDYQGLAASRQFFYPLWIATFNPSRLDPPARQPDAFSRAMRAR
jgi:hypothetical protein